MLDIQLFRENPEAIKADLRKREWSEDDIQKIDNIINLDKVWRDLKQEADQLKHERNTAAKEISHLKKSGQDASGKIQRMKEINAQIERFNQDIDKAKNNRDTMLMRIPNILHESVPVGDDSGDNVEVRRWGELPQFQFELQSHGELAEALGLGDWKNAGKISGAGFVFLKGSLALLDQALVQFTIHEMVKRSYTLVFPPFMMNRKSYEGVTDLSDFETVMYKIEDEDLYLIATSEHPICGMLMDEVIDEEELPLKYAGYSTNFRREIGAHGLDTKGLFRMHQFNKVEQFIFCRPEESWQYHEELINNAEEIFKRLELPYRIVNICTGDIGTVAAKKYDLEIWSPRQEKYIEAVSCSNCTDYQARRLNIKWGKRGGDKELVHTLNSTALATSRALVGIMENFQNEDGTIKVPEVLRPYMGGVETIG